MILLIDIGNTNTVCAIYNSQKYLEIKRVDKKEDIQPILEIFLKYNVTDIAIASVVPILENIFIQHVLWVYRCSDRSAQENVRKIRAEQASKARRGMHDDTPTELENWISDNAAAVCVSHKSTAFLFFKPPTR